MKTQQIDLAHFIQLYWFAPPVALWRAVEARAVARQSYQSPLLDFGCGHGRFALAVFGQGAVYVGCDLLHFQLAEARRVGAHQILLAADGHRLPYPDGAFASVFSNSVLEHIPQPLPVLTELGRVLRPGGRLIITAPSDHLHEFLTADDAAYRAEIDRRLQHFHYHTPAEWANLLQQAGLQPIDHHYYMTPAATRAWDRLNQQFGIGRRSLFSLLVSPRFRFLGYQKLLARWLPAWLDSRLRPWYEQQVASGQVGGGLLLVAARP